MMKCTIGPQPSISIYNFGALWRKDRIRLWSSAGAIIESSLWMLAQSLLRALSNIKGIPGQRGGTVGLPVGGASAPDQHAQQRVA